MKPPGLDAFQTGQDKLWVVPLLSGFVLAILTAWWSEFTVLNEVPTKWTLPISTWINVIVSIVVAMSQGIARAISITLSAPMTIIRDVLGWAPWATVVAVIAVIGFAAAGWRLAIFSLLSCFYVLTTGHWMPTMSTMALMILAIPIAVILGFFVGALAERSSAVNRITQPCLDFMQTVPAFAYLIPILLLFGFGPVVGLLTSIIFAIPPMVRNTILGLQRVPLEIRESARMSGCTRNQEFWWARVPAAMPQLLVGLNQTTMAAFSMIIIASVIGGFQDIGWEVLSTMRKAQFGQSLTAGLVIALLAMVLYRITAGFAEQSRSDEPIIPSRPLALLLATAVAVSLGLASVWSPLWVWPSEWVASPAALLNHTVDFITMNYGGALEGFKTFVLYFYLLPLKIGLVQTISPYTWGFEFGAVAKTIYWIAVALSALGLWFFSRGAAAVAAVVIGTLLYFGTTGIPWLVMITAVSLVALHFGGVRVALFCICAQTFILLSGFWDAAMLSLYLCLAAVIVCFAVGLPVAVAASKSDRLSEFVKPVTDSLQTIPQFVLLIPVLMFFNSGDFAAFLAVIFYAIVPVIKYSESGLRNVPSDLIDAGRSMGCTRTQLLWQIELPHALPEILLGVNQTVMSALAMLVIAALVGTNDLGQEVYVSLGKADAGRGLVAGIGIALIAMMADRILQSSARKQRLAQGLI
jgi:glycine betaine/proline transport system permease protein